MKLTRWSHACVALEHDGRVLVVDPGVWSEDEALVGADAVLLTHHHGDHVDVDRVTASGVPVWAPHDAELGELPFTPLAVGDLAAVAGFEVRAVGGRHATILTGQEVCTNLGYVVTAGGGSVYHPGDALHVPDAQVDVALVPMQASWLKTEEAIAFLQAVAPTRAVGIHDGQVNERGVAGLNHWLATRGGTAYEWLPPGATLD